MGDEPELVHYSYTAMRDGATYEGTMEAPDRFAVYARVKAEGGEIVSVRQASGVMGWLRMVNERFSTVKEVDKIIFARNLAAMLGAGLSLARCLGAMERQTKSPKLKYIVRSVSGSVRKGGALHEALAQHPHTFSALFIAMVHAGEEGGKLPDALQSIAVQMDKSYKLKKKVKGALLYPGVVLTAMVGIGFLMMTEVVPTLKQTFDELGVNLPPTTQAVIAASDFLVKHTLVALAGVLLVVVGFVYALRTPQGKRLFDNFILRLPAVGSIVKEVQSARFARTLSSLLGSGVSIVDSLTITSEVVGNVYHRDVVLAARAVVEKGEAMSSIFNLHEDLYPPLVGEMMAVGEETGELSTMLTRVADFYESEVEQKTKDMSTIIEPFLMLFIGAGVGFFALAMIAPIYSLSDAI